MTDAQASALPRLSVGDRVRVIARLDIPNPHDLPIGYVGVVEEVFPNGDVDLGEWACRRDEVELVGDEPVRAVPAPTGDMVLVPREPTELMLTDGVLAGTFPWTDVIPPGVDEDRYVLAAIYRAMIAAAPSPSASTIGVDVDALAQEIRRVDGRHDLGAGALAEALMPFLGRCQSSAGGEGVVEAPARLPVARIIDDNQPGATAIVAIVCDPPTLGVGTLLYSRPRDHAAELVEAYCAGQRDASPTPPKAETETESEPDYPDMEENGWDEPLEDALLETRRDVIEGYANTEAQLRHRLTTLSSAAPEGRTETASEPTTDAPVQDTWFTDRSLPVMAMSGDVESNRVIKLHFRRPVSDADRRALCDALNLYQRFLDPGPAETASEHTLTRAEALDALAADYGERMHPETASERERLVEAAKTVVRMGQIDPSGRDLSWRLQMQQSIEDLAAALAQEPAR